MALEGNGLFDKSRYAKEEINKQTATEKINLKITTAQMDTYAQEQRMPTLKELSLVLKEDDEISYVTEESKVASTEYNVASDNPSIIYTKLKEYDYEFGINSSLQLASINGVKIASNDETINSILSRLDALERSVSMNSLTKLGTITGGGSETSNYLEIPECNELVVCVDFKNAGTDIITLNIPYEELTEQFKKYRSGTYFSSTNAVGTVVAVNNEKIYLLTVKNASTDNTATSTMRVYYK